MHHSTRRKNYLMASVATGPHLDVSDLVKIFFKPYLLIIKQCQPFSMHVLILVWYLLIRDDVVNPLTFEGQKKKELTDVQKCNDGWTLPIGCALWHSLAFYYVGELSRRIKIFFFPCLQWEHKDLNSWSKQKVLKEGPEGSQEINPHSAD